jgi:hypothetical protein
MLLGPFLFPTRDGCLRFHICERFQEERWSWTTRSLLEVHFCCNLLYVATSVWSTNYLCIDCRFKASSVFSNCNAHQNLAFVVRIS